MQERPARPFPGVDAALDMAGGCEPGVLRRLHRHCRALAEGTVEDDALAGGSGEFVQHAARADIVRKLGVGGVQRARDDAVLLAFRPLAQIDERHVGPAVEGHGLGGADRPAPPRDLLLGKADAHVGRHGDIHHLGIGQIEIVHQLDILIH